MESEIEKESQQYDKFGIWPAIYQEIKVEAAEIAFEEELSTKEAKQPTNKNRNRYRDVYPYDHSRVKLQKGEDDYINACYLPVPEANRNYILAQGPLEHTSGHFWQMVWEQKSKAVVMLNKVIESGSRKCHQYWPLGENYGDDEEMVYEDVQLKITLLEERSCNYYIVRTLEIEDMQTSETREILHFNYVTWPDFGVPTSPTAFLNFLMAVRESGGLEPDSGPCVVHCSAGIGRSGTFCLVDSVLVIIENQEHMNGIDIRKMVLDMRYYRMGLIQTADQLRFSYLAIIEGGRRLLNKEQISTMDVLSSYLEEEKSSDDEAPPKPPTRVESLPHRNEPPPLPPRTGFQNTVDNMEGLNSKESVSGTSESQLRRRNREDRKKKTEEQVRKMKDKLRDSELSKKRKSYLKPVAIGLTGLTLLIGGFLIYTFYFKNLGHDKG